jgi:hypothetical protein
MYEDEFYGQKIVPTNPVKPDNLECVGRLIILVLLSVSDTILQLT